MPRARALTLRSGALLWRRRHRGRVGDWGVATLMLVLVLLLLAMVLLLVMAGDRPHDPPGSQLGRVSFARPSEAGGARLARGLYLARLHLADPARAKESSPARPELALEGLADVLVTGCVPAPKLDNDYVAHCVSTGTTWFSTDLFFVFDNLGSGSSKGRSQYGAAWLLI